MLIIVDYYADYCFRRGDTQRNNLHPHSEHAPCNAVPFLSFRCTSSSHEESTCTPATIGDAEGQHAVPPAVERNFVSYPANASQQNEVHPVVEQVH